MGFDVVLLVFGWEVEVGLGLVWVCDLDWDLD